MSATKFLIGVLVLCASAAVATANLIGWFPGLKKLIEESDAIVILRVDRHVNTDSFEPSPIIGVPYTTHDCYIYQTLKGDLLSGKNVRLRLMDTRVSFVTPYAVHSTHLMFLTKKRSPDEPTDYRTIEFEGANILLSPLGHEKTPEGKTLVEKIKNVVRSSLSYSQKQQREERRFLTRILRD
jgi:hypothetical protein